MLLANRTFNVPPLFELRRELGGAAKRRKPRGEQPMDLRIAAGSLIGQGDQPVAEITHGEHVERLAQAGRAAAGVERRDEMNRAVREELQRAAERLECAPAAEKENPWTELGLAPIAGDA